MDLAIIVSILPCHTDPVPAGTAASIPSVDRTYILIMMKNITIKKSDVKSTVTGSASSAALYMIDGMSDAENP